jgi:microsomal epoxide hydrolase
MPKSLGWIPFLLIVAVAGLADSDVQGNYFTTSDGVRLHYLDEGEGPTVVFIPGWMNPATIWEPQIRHFSKDYRVVALDPRSQGESEQVTEGHYPERRSRDIKELIEHLEVPSVVLVGFSMGGPEVLSYVDQFGTNSLDGIVLVDNHIGSDFDAGRTQQVFGMIQAFNADREQMLENFLPYAFKKPQPEEYMAKIKAATMSIPSNTAVALLAAYQGRDWRPVLAKVDKPLLYAITPGKEEQGQMVEKEIPSARVERFPEAGHVIFADETERFNSILEEFLEASFGR